MLGDTSPLAITQPRIRFLASLSLGDVEPRKIKGGGQYWVVLDRRTSKWIRCDSMINRLVTAGWLKHGLANLLLTDLGQQILAVRGSDEVRQIEQLPRPDLTGNS